MACNQFGCLAGISRFYMRDELAVLAKDRGTPGEREIETPAHSPQHFAMLPPKLGGMAVIVPLVHHGVKGGIQLAVPERVGKIVLFDQALDTFEFGNVLDGSHIHKPSRQCWLDQDSDLVDIPNKILVYRPDARPTVGNKGDKALAPQQLQSLAHGVGRGTVTPGEIGDHKPFVGSEPPLDDVFPDQLIKRSALAGGPDRVDPFGWLCFEIACFGQGCPQINTRFNRYHARFP